MLKTAWPLTRGHMKFATTCKFKLPARPPCLTTCSTYKPSRAKQHCTNGYSPKRKQPVQEDTGTSLPEKTSGFWAQTERAVLYHSFLVHSLRQISQTEIITSPPLLLSWEGQNCSSRAWCFLQAFQSKARYTTLVTQPVLAPLLSITLSSEHKHPPTSNHSTVIYICRKLVYAFSQKGKTKLTLKQSHTVHLTELRKSFSC